MQPKKALSFCKQWRLTWRCKRGEVLQQHFTVMALNRCKWECNSYILLLRAIAAVSPEVYHSTCKRMVNQTTWVWCLEGFKKWLLRIGFCLKIGSPLVFHGSPNKNMVSRHTHRQTHVSPMFSLNIYMASCRTSFLQVPSLLSSDSVCCSIADKHGNSWTIQPFDTRTCRRFGLWTSDALWRLICGVPLQ